MLLCTIEKQSQIAVVVEQFVAAGYHEPLGATSKVNARRGYT